MVRLDGGTAGGLRKAGTWLHSYTFKLGRKLGRKLARHPRIAGNIAKNACFALQRDAIIGSQALAKLSAPQRQEVLPP